MFFRLFDLLYDNDLVIIYEMKDVMKEAVLTLESAIREAGLIINVKKQILIH